MKKKKTAVNCNECGSYTASKLIKFNDDFLEVCEYCYFRLKQEELREEIYK